MSKTRLAAVWFALLVAALASRLVADPSAEAEKPAAEATTQPAFLQMVRAGVDNVPRAFNTVSLEIIGDYLYAGDTASPGIDYFKRGPDGTITYCGTEPIMKDRGPLLCAAGGRLYVLLANYCNYSIACYDIDPATGKLTQKGTNTPVKCDWAGALIADREGKNLYMWAQSKMLRFKIGADGTPELAGEVVGNGFPPWGSSVLRMSPDGKYIYAINGQTLCIACVERKPDGAVAFKKAISLAGLDKQKGVKAQGFLSISPDGNWVYATLWRAENPGCSIGIFKRDAETGDLTLQEAGSGNDGTRGDYKLSNLSSLNLVFLPDGTAGYAGTSAGALLQTFRRDPATGHISDVMDITAVDYRQFSSAALVLDDKKGILYGTGGNGTASGLWILKAQKPPAAGARSEIQTPVVGTGVTAGPTSAFDWPRWRGANCDQKSPIKGIRKDWAGGLKEVWAVKGLSPGTATFSAPCVKGDKVVVMGRHGAVDQLFCFDADKGGKPLWIVEYATNPGGDYGYGDGPQGTPCIDGDKVYFTSRQGNFLCASLADGKILWRKGIGTDNHGYGASPLVWDDLVMIPLSDGKALSACKKDTGEKVWTYGDHPGNEGRVGFVSPIRATVGGKEQVVFYFGEHVCGLDHATGQPLWDVSTGIKFPSFAYCSPIVSDSMVYAPYSNAPAAVKVEGATAAVSWSKHEKDEGFFTPGWCEAVESEGYLYAFVNRSGFGGFAGDLRCVDLKTGKTKWEEKNTGSGNMTLVDGCLLCLTYPGDLLLVSATPDGFKKITEMKGVMKRNTRWMHHGMPGDAGIRPGQIPCYTMPIVARGKVYLRLSDELLCYDLMN